MAEKPLTNSINALTAYINEVTGGTDDNLSDAIATLAEGYGSGGYSADDILYGPGITGDVIAPNVTRISSYALYGRSGVTSIKADSVIDMYPRAFENCTNLRTVDFPNLTTFVQASGNQFHGCTKLVNVKMPKITAISSNCFNGCTSLTTISLPKCTSIGSGAFSGCTALTDIYLPNAASTYTGAPWGATNATIHYNTTFDENGEPVIE